MIDYSYNYSAGLALIPFAIFLFMLFRYRSGLNFQYAATSKEYYILWLLTSLYSTFGFLEPDTYHYHAIYDYLLDSDKSFHVEDVYFYLAKFIPRSYYLWRFIIWGGASAIMVILLKQLNISPRIAGLFIPLVFLHRLVVTRGGLGFEVMLLASLIFVDNRYSIVKRVAFCSILIFCATFLHRSIAFFVLFVPISLFFVLNKGSYLLSLIAFPFLYCSIMALSNSIIELGLFNESSVNFMVHYEEQEIQRQNIFGVIQDFISIFPLAILALYILPKFYIKHNNIDKRERFLIRYSFIVMYVGMLFYGQNMSSWVSARTIHAATFSLILCVPYYFQYKSKLMKLDILVIGMLLFSVTLLYLLRIKTWL